MINSDVFLAIFNFYRGGLFEMAASQVATNSAYLVIFGLIVAFLVYSHNKKIRTTIILVTTSGIIGALVSAFVHMLYKSPRPFIRLGLAPSIVTYDFASFPSGHTTFLAAIAMAVFMKSRFWGALLFLLALSTGLARIHAGIHWPSDILVGFGIGVIIGYCVIRFGESAFRQYIKS